MNEINPAPAACGNCGSLLKGPWCHRCGQEAHDPMQRLQLQPAVGAGIQCRVHVQPVVALQGGAVTAPTGCAQHHDRGPNLGAGLGQVLIRLRNNYSSN